MFINTPYVPNLAPATAIFDRAAARAYVPPTSDSAGLALGVSAALVFGGGALYLSQDHNQSAGPVSLVVPEPGGVLAVGFGIAAMCRSRRKVRTNA
jgi:hypothetical protein